MVVLIITHLQWTEAEASIGSDKQSHESRNCRRWLLELPGRAYDLGGGTYSLGSEEPGPKKYASICSTRNCWASGFQGWSRYSLSSILECSPHMRQASALTFS